MNEREELRKKKTKQDGSIRTHHRRNEIMFSHVLGKQKVTIIGKKNDRERLEEEKENNTTEALELIAEERHILQIAPANFS